MKAKNYISAKLWGEKQTPLCSRRRVHVLFNEGRLEGAIRPQREIFIPENCPDPRMKIGKPALNAKNIKRIKKE